MKPTVSPYPGTGCKRRSRRKSLDADTSVLGDVWERLTESELGPAFTTASTLLGVTALGFTGQLVEVDLTAAL